MTAHSLLAAFALAGFASSAALAQTFTGTGGPLVDATSATQAGVGAAFFDIDVTGTGATVASVDSVTLTGLAHTLIGDTGIYLIAPDGTSYSVLTSPPVNEPANFNGTYTFVVDPALMSVDEAILGQPTGYDLPGGTYAISDYGNGVTAGPRSSFDDLVGQSLDGTWTLEIDDYFPGDTGSLASWGFAVTVVPEPTTLAAIGLAGVMVRRRK